MPTYRITGLTRDTGEPRTFEVDAANETEALVNAAERRGVVVESCTLIKGNSRFASP